MGVTMMIAVTVVVESTRREMERAVTVTLGIIHDDDDDGVGR